MSRPFGWCFSTSFFASAMSPSLGWRQPGILLTSSSGRAKSPSSLGSRRAHGTPAPSRALATISCRSIARLTARRRSGWSNGGFLEFRDEEDGVDGALVDVHVLPGAGELVGLCLAHWRPEIPEHDLAGLGG